MSKYACPCCENLTLEECPPGTFEICPVCGWEDDDTQFYNPDLVGGANSTSLNLAKLNFKKTGAVDDASLKFVRPAKNSEKP
ncbi:MAG: hydrolase [Bdellovibrionaceae bacterium]|nr:hydrolase [Pseudobdellovibrionaceae bacterium]